MENKAVVFVKSLAAHGVLMGLTDQNECVVLCDGIFYTVHDQDIVK